MSRIVIALGGNALGDTYLEQQDLLKNASKELIKLFTDNEIVITHGNGPQVGMITKAMTENKVEMPLDCCTAMSEGYIGFHIQRKVKQTLLNNNIDRNVVTLLTEVEVDQEDKSFKNPTKPIGKFFTKEEAEQLQKETGDIYIEDSGRGYRKVVASPKPINVLNVNAIENLLESGTIVVACGGGGIPVFKDYNNKKVEAVIDKDLSSSLLAQKLNADKFIILTTVEQAKLNFGEENEAPIGRISKDEALKYMEEGHFKKGSMLPKVEAAVNFVKGTGNEAIITSLANIKGIVENKNITVIEK